jgi:hypothetical protein
MMAGISLPSWLYEPLSILQRQAEMIEYSEVLCNAAQCEDPVERLAFIAGFAVSGYSATQRYKPDFNPILGETFEYVDSRNNTKFLAEQVSHHPPISALQAVHDNWIFWQNSCPTTKFLGNSIDVDTQGRSHIIFPKKNEHYFYTNPQCTRIHNIIIGSMWIEHFGNLEIKNLDGSFQCTVAFKKSGIFQGTQYKVEGYIIDNQGKRLVKLEGRWNESLEGKWLEDTEFCKKGQVRKLWNIAADTFLHDQYNWTQYTASLNRMTPTEEAVILPSDSRRRLDRKNLEQGDPDTATYWKKLIEERQRSDRKARKEPWKSLWFKKIDPATTPNEPYPVWVYDSDYWEQRARKEEAFQNGELQVISEMVPPQLRGLACDFLSFQKQPLQVMVVPKTETAIITIDPPVENQNGEKPPEKRLSVENSSAGSPDQPSVESPPAPKENHVIAEENHQSVESAPEQKCTNENGQNTENHQNIVESKEKVTIQENEVGTTNTSLQSNDSLSLKEL